MTIQIAAIMLVLILVYVLVENRKSVAWEMKYGGGQMFGAFLSKLFVAVGFTIIVLAALAVIINFIF